eukprot:GHVU01150157.1.p1 GENE.GHVU01150157.1~~GHVU01150157.1.p1  ORF type:complete len:155 (+),score=3.89 GHVU01150157.1:450-914(+)
MSVYIYVYVHICICMYVHMYIHPPTTDKSSNLTSAVRSDAQSVSLDNGRTIVLVLVLLVVLVLSLLSLYAMIECIHIHCIDRSNCSSSLHSFIHSFIVLANRSPYAPPSSFIHSSICLFITLDHSRLLQHSLLRRHTHRQESRQLNAKKQLAKR